MDEQPQGQKIVLNLYAAFGVSLILSVLPSYSAAFLSMVFFIGVLVAAYALRRNNEHGSLIENHATFLIRTLWITAFFSIFTTALATLYLLKDINYAQFDPCANALAAKGLAWAENAGMMDVYMLIEPCVAPFVDGNMTLLLNAVVIAGAPLVIYMAYRMAKGVGRAMKGYRISDHKSWF